MSEGFEGKGDFLTILLQDELFKGQEEYIVDECITFMIASTQTTTLLVSNALYYLTCQKDKLKHLRKEMSKFLPKDQYKSGFTSLSDDQWKGLLLDKEIVVDCNYLSYCITETLRINPSVQSSTQLEVTDTIELGGRTLLKGQTFSINIMNLHKNPSQWQNPN